MAINRSVKVVLCDIEGTTTSIHFVKNILFPYSQAKMKEFLSANWENSEIKQLITSILAFAETENFEQLTKNEEENDDIDFATKTINMLIQKDYKQLQLKKLQGLIWKKGYEGGELKGHVFPDVPEAFQKWITAGIKICIYSSGSVEAQKLLFGCSEFGNMLQYISEHFDTNFGMKTSQESYSKITKHLNCDPKDIVFLTDIKEEAYAANEAGLYSILVNREGNINVTEEDRNIFPVVSSFNDINLCLK